MSKIDMTVMEKKVADAKRALATKAANRGQKPYYRKGKLVRGHGEQDGKNKPAGGARKLSKDNLLLVHLDGGKSAYVDYRQFVNDSAMLRVYRKDGTLTNRRIPHSLVTDYQAEGD